MTNQQGAPEALRLADALCKRVAESSTLSWFDGDLAYAAAELRHLHAETERLATTLWASLFKVLSTHGTFDTAERAREDAENAYHALYPGYKQDGVQPFYSWVVQEMEVIPTSAARAPADSVTAQASGAERIKLANRIKKCAEHWAYMERIDHGDQAKVEQERHAELVEMLAAPTPPAQAADSVLEDARKEIERLNAIINTPQSDDFLRAVSTEAEHQRQRWGSAHDAGKTPADWFWLIGYLAGKALHAHAAGNSEKAEHHIITTAAAALNWHRALFGKTDMRPGIDPGSIDPASSRPKEEA